MAYWRCFDSSSLGCLFWRLNNLEETSLKLKKRLAEAQWRLCVQCAGVHCTLSELRASRETSRRSQLQIVSDSRVSGRQSGRNWKASVQALCASWSLESPISSCRRGLAGGLAEQESAVSCGSLPRLRCARAEGQQEEEEEVVAHISSSAADCKRVALRKGPK